MRVFLFISVFFCGSVFGQSKALIVDGVNIDSLVKAKQREAIGQNLAAFSTRYQGKRFTNSNLSGKILYANFWYAACTPCMAEMPTLNRLYDSLKDSKDFEFVSFTTEKQKVINRIKKKFCIRYRIVSISSQQANALTRDMGYPASIITDRDGIIKLFKIGGSMERVEIEQTILSKYYLFIIKELKRS